MEWHERHLESKPHQEQRDAGEQHRVVTRQGNLGGKHRGDATEIRLTCLAVDESDAVKQEGRGKTTEDEVLQAGLLARRATPIACRQDIEREAENLDAKEHGEQVIGTYHHGCAERRSKHERVGLERVTRCRFGTRVE